MTAEWPSVCSRRATDQIGENGAMLEVLGFACYLSAWREPRRRADRRGGIETTSLSLQSRCRCMGKHLQGTMRRKQYSTGVLDLSTLSLRSSLKRQLDMVVNQPK